MTYKSYMTYSLKKVKMSLKILHVDTSINWRGGEQQLLYLFTGLQKKGYSQLIACQPDSLLLKRCQGYAATIPVRMWGEWDIAAVCKLARLIDIKGIQLVHLHSSHAHALGLMAAKISRSKPAVVVSRRVDFHLRKNPISWIKYRIGVNRIIAVSNAVKQVLISDGIRPEEIDVVHDGIDVEWFGKDIDNDYLYQEFGLNHMFPIVGIIAALAPHKDHKTFLQACSHVKKTNHQVQFLIVGNGELRCKLQQMVKRLDIENNVIFTGFRNDIPQILSILTVFVVSSYLEGLNTSILEAQSAGVPVIATRTGGIPEIIQDGINGLLVLPQHPESLAEGIIQLIGNKTLSNQLAAIAKKDVRKFNMEAMIDTTEAVYHRVMGMV
ncbi:glycosyltransferase family 4 protein [Candidatus Desantisbacteria bacterium]|nr:glycosyltransferase family 4 protein [Candidatus Desantisbacteria bacterium]